MQIVQKESLLRFVEVICRHGRWSSVSRNLSLRHFPTPVISTWTWDSRTDGSKIQSFSIIIIYFLICWSQPVSLDFVNGYLGEHMCCKCSCTYASAQRGRSKEARKQAPRRALPPLLSTRSLSLHCGAARLENQHLGGADVRRPRCYKDFDEHPTRLTPVGSAWTEACRWSIIEDNVTFGKLEL